MATLRHSGLSAQNASRIPTQRLTHSRTSLSVNAIAAPGSVSFNHHGSQIQFVGGSANNGFVNGVPQPVTVTVAAPPPAVLTPADTYKAAVALGAKKAGTSASKLFVSGILAGCFIAYGAYLTVSVQGGLLALTATMPGLVKLIGAFIFPVGLLLVVLSGAELYTGNTAVVTMAKNEKQATTAGLLRNWFWSYFGNLVGSLAMVAAVYATGTLIGNPVPASIATYKASLPWTTALVRSMLCNWLVCMAVWNATAAASLPGKLMGLWPPIATFVAIGLEHSVANMFFIPMGIVMGAKVSWSQFFLNNLLPVTLGNTLAGVLFVATAMGFMHGSLGAEKTTHQKQQTHSLPTTVAGTR